MSGHDLYVLSPELCVVVGALLVVVAGMANLHRGVVTALGLAGVGGALAFTLLLWGELDGSWSLSSTVDGDSVTAFYGALQLDRFALFFKGLVTISAGLVLLASHAYTQRFAVRGPEFVGLILLSAVGMMLLAGGRELITLYVALELSTLPLVALAAFSGGQRASEAGLKYLVLGAVASAVLLYGMALTFGYTGSTVLETIALSVGDAALDGSRPFGVQALVLGVVLMVAGFGFKIAAVPFHGWIPDVYEGAPTPVTAFLSVASKAAGFAVLMRVFFTAFEPLEVDWALLFAGIAAASMTFGNLAAISQTNIKRMLAYSTIAHAGYLLVGLAAVASRTADGVTIGPETVLFYLGGYAVTNLAAFFAVIAIADRTGSESIPSFSGMGRRRTVAGRRAGRGAAVADGHPADGRVHGQALRVWRGGEGGPGVARRVGRAQQRGLRLLLPSRRAGHVPRRTVRGRAARPGPAARPLRGRDCPGCRRARPVAAAPLPRR